jgi:hypothetical protein
VVSTVSQHAVHVRNRNPKVLFNVIVVQQSIRIFRHHKHTLSRRVLLPKADLFKRSNSVLFVVRLIGSLPDRLSCWIFPYFLDSVLAESRTRDYYVFTTFLCFCLPC